MFSEHSLVTEEINQSRAISRREREEKVKIWFIRMTREVESVCWHQVANCLIAAFVLSCPPLTVRLHIIILLSAYEYLE